MPTRPLLIAEWRNLLLLNFTVPTDLVARLAPPGTEPDEHDGQSYISVVGFRFERVRLLGLAIPGHTSFPEINLRYYVRRQVDGELRRGVVFAREIVPRRAVAIAANRLYNENYITRRMRSHTPPAGQGLTPTDTISYSWRCPPIRLRLSDSIQHWNTLSAQPATPLALPPKNSADAFFVEHYWGYVRARDGHTREYRVTHPPWRTAPAINITWNCHIESTYNSPLAEYLAVPPASATIAEGSAIQLYRGAEV